MCGVNGGWGVLGSWGGFSRERDRSEGMPQSGGWGAVFLDAVRQALMQTVDQTQRSKMALVVKWPRIVRGRKKLLMI
jgi:hypothetical protein